MGFVSLGLRGFGGMAAHARYFFVVERKWLEEREFAELFGICQAIPGPNVVGMSIVLGDRAYGPLGSIVCVSALCIPPTILAVLVAALIQIAAHDPATIAIERGVVAGAGGLMISTGLRTLYGITKARRIEQTVPLLLVAAATVVLVLGEFVALPIVVIAMIVVAYLLGRMWSPDTRRA